MSIQPIDIPSGPEPLYRRLANALGDRIRSGQIPAGTRLPPHRDFAYQLGISVGSVARAYTLLAEDGIVSGEVGRGTIVRQKAKNEAIGLETDVSRIDMRLVVPPPLDDPDLTADLGPRTLATISRQWSLFDMPQFPGEFGRAQHRKAAAAWMEERGVAASPSEVLLTYGGQEGTLATLLALAGRSRQVLCEELTMSSLKNLATTMGLTLIPMRMDAEGLMPQALDQAARRHEARVAVLYPSLQIPTGRRMSADRRRDIAALARRHDLTIVEGACYSETLDCPPDDFSNYIPERSISIHSLSNTVLPGMRCGLLRASAEHLALISAARHATVLATSTLVAEVLTAWLQRGHAGRVVAAQRASLVRRHAVLAEVFPEVASRTPAGSPFAWVPLAGQTSSDVVAAASLRRVEVLPAERFLVPGADPVSALRLAISTPRTEAELLQGLRALKGVIEGH